MRGIKNKDLEVLKREIDALSDEHQLAILKILVEGDVKYAENSNGVFFDLKLLTKDNIDGIRKIIKFVKDSEEHENAREREVSVLKEELKEDV